MAQPPEDDELTIAASDVTVESSAAAVAALTEKPGDRIGRYTLFKRLGEGGFGAVYIAEQKEPVRREKQI